jgi:hypothetical protein
MLIWRVTQRHTLNRVWLGVRYRLSSKMENRSWGPGSLFSFVNLMGRGDGRFGSKLSEYFSKYLLFQKFGAFNMIPI